MRRVRVEVATDDGPTYEVELEGPGNKGLKSADKIHQFIAAVRSADGL